jgi:hypothetical protein
MQLIQILLPLFDNNGKAFPAAYHQRVKQELSDRFHGLTAYSRAPAEGIWKTSKTKQSEDMIVYEVMTRSHQARWWKGYRRKLEKLFRQESVVIRAQKIKLL